MAVHQAMMEAVFLDLWGQPSPSYGQSEVRANTTLVTPHRHELEEAGVVPFSDTPVELRGTGICGLVNTPTGQFYTKNMEP